MDAGLDHTCGRLRIFPSLVTLLAEEVSCSTRVVTDTPSVPNLASFVSSRLIVLSSELVVNWCEPLTVAAVAVSTMLTSSIPSVSSSTVVSQSEPLTVSAVVVSIVVILYVRETALGPCLSYRQQRESRVSSATRDS